ncbi:MAG: hypothetical protein ABIN67_10645 [Ferruginibacter sp.]
MKADTQILDKKIELIQWLSSLDDKVVIDKLLEFRKTETKDWWETTQDEEKTSIMKGIKDADNNKLKPSFIRKKNL